MVPRALPEFTDHPEDTKNHRFQTPITPPEQVRLFLQRHSEMGARRAHRVLDVGCGRGDTVAWLRARGWDAYGVDVDADYVERGRAYLASAADDPARLQLVRDDLSFPFEDGFFDIVLSDQVIEHVPNLNALAAEVARVSAPASRGLHIYPARWYPVEPHLKTPFTHWLPKGPVRRTAEAVCLRTGLAAPYFTEYSLAERMQIYSKYSEEHTFYRSVTSTIAVMERHGLVCDARQAAQDRVALRLPTVRGPALAMLGWMCRHLHSVALYTVKPGS